MGTASHTYGAPGLYIAGQWRSGSAATTSPVINPATGETLDRLTHASTADLDAALAAIAAEAGAPPRVFALSTRGRVRFDAPDYREHDAFLFGSETAGLPPEVLARVPEAQRLRLPMRPGNRSLNLSNTVAVVVFEAWRQAGFDGGA